MRLRGEYVQRLPRKVRRRLEVRFDHIVHSGALHGVLTLLLVLVLADLVRVRSTSGSSEAGAAPSEKKVA